jgi:2-polyprenyl-3-methyl-5-hydroxy-6-metoxy-1,4-benzoquinol methylase
LEARVLPDNEFKILFIGTSMTVEYIHCPLCDADNTRLIFKRKDLRYHVSEEDFCVVRCRKCSLVYVNPRPTEAEIHAYYTDEFYNTQTSAEQLRIEKEKQWLLKDGYVKDLTPGSLLDVGCGKGDFMYFMQQKGWNVRGVDFSTKPPNVFGLDIFHGDLEAAGYLLESFDLVTLWAVLEHVYHPQALLMRINQLLKPGGRVVLLVTNFDSLPARFMRHDDVPRHTTLFTKRTLGEMLRRVGLTPHGFHSNCQLFGGSHRGLLNYVAKLVAGEQLGEIVAQNRSVTRWNEFSTQLRGNPAKLMTQIDQIDIALTPYLDRWFDRLGLGFIMIVQATKPVRS